MADKAKTVQLTAPNGVRVSVEESKGEALRKGGFLPLGSGKGLAQRAPAKKTAASDKK